VDERTQHVATLLQTARHKIGRALRDLDEYGAALDLLLLAQAAEHLAEAVDEADHRHEIRRGPE